MSVSTIFDALLPSWPARRHRHSFLTHGLINRLAATGDIICLLLAAYVATWAGGQDITLPQSLLLSLLAAYPFRMINGNRQAYRWDRYRSVEWEIFDAFAGLLGGLLLLWLFLIIFRPEARFAGWLFLWFGAALSLLGTERVAIRHWVGNLQRRGLFCHRVAIVGAGPEGEAAVRNILAAGNRTGAYQVIGIFDDRASRRPDTIEGIPVTQGVGRLLQITREAAIDAVVIALPLQARARIAEVTQRLSAVSIDVLLLMEVNWLNSREVKLLNIDGYPFLQVARRPLRGSMVLLKLIEDYTIAMVSLILTAPVMLAIALAIRLEGPGPIFFRQRRIGFNQVEFDMLKFRSMALDPKDDGSRGTDRDDPRITRVGRFIRKYSLDELPQLFNVLRGEMSIVGPRAHVPKMLIGNQIYPEAVAEYVARHRVKPGITGWAQINGMRGGIRDTAKARRGVALDLEYIENWSPWLDLRIILRTIFGGMSGHHVF
jgi:polysaccharide biosynthesis protein PslA